VQLIDFIETDRNLKVATTNYDTVSQGGGKFFRELDAPLGRSLGRRLLRGSLLKEERIFGTNDTHC